MPTWFIVTIAGCIVVAGAINALYEAMVKDDRENVKKQGRY